MQERETPGKDNFVMSAKQDEREETYDYTGADSGRVARRSMKPVVIAGGALLAAIVVLLMFMSGSPRSAEKDLLKNMDARLKTIEEKMAKLEWIDTGLARLDRREKDIAALSERMVQMEAVMNRKVDQVAREAARPAPPVKSPEPAPKVEPAAHKPEPSKPPAPIAKAAAPTTPKAKTHTVQKGETLYAISRKYSVPADQLMKANKLTPKESIKIGQVLAIP